MNKLKTKTPQSPPADELNMPNSPLWIDNYEEDVEQQEARKEERFSLLGMDDYQAESCSPDLGYLGIYSIFLMRLDFKTAIFRKNSILTEIKTRFNIEEVNMFDSYFKTEFMNIIKKLYLDTFKGDFDWGLYENEMGSLCMIMKNFAFDCYDPYSVFLYSDGIHEILPLDVLVALLSIPYDRYGYPLYDSISRMKSILFSTLLTHHLGGDTRFLPKLEGKNLKNMSTLLRTHIRQTNRRDKVILAKYLNVKFDIRKFASTMLELYIPNISWRYIGGEVYQPYWVFKLIRAIFELGLYTVGDLTELLSHLTNKIENILKLEMAIKNDYWDGKLDNYPDYLSSLALMVVFIRKEVAAICLHSTILYNDLGLEEALPWGPKFNNLTNYEESLERTIFNQTTLSGIIYMIMSRFLILEDTYDVSWMNNLANIRETLLTLQFKRKIISERKIFDEIFKELFMMFSKKSGDLFSKSNQMVTDQQIEIMLSADENSKELLDQALVVKKALEELFIQHKIVNYNEPKAIISLAHRSSLVYKQILDLLHEKLGISPVQSSTFCTYLALNNCHKILLSCVLMLIELLESVKRNPNHEAIYQCVDVLSQVCQSEIGQILFFTDSNWELIEYFSKLRPVFFALLIDRIFSTNKELFYRQEVLFQNFLRIYRGLVLQVESGIQELVGTEANSLLKEDIDCLEQIDSVKACISLIVFNNTLQNLIIVGGDSKSANFNKNLDLVVQRAICQIVNRVLLPKVLSSGHIALNKNGEIRTKKFPPLNDSQSLNNLARKTKIYDEEMRTLLFTVGWSTIELFTKCTSRLYYDFVRCQTLANLNPETFEKDFEYLLSLEDGLTYKTILMNLFANFHIFPSNHCISDSRIELSLTQQNTTFLTTVIGGDFNSDQVVRILLQSMENIKAWTVATFPKTQIQLPSEALAVGIPDTWKVEQVKHFAFKGILPGVYKYLKGLVSLLTVSHTETTKSKLVISKLLAQVKVLDTKFWEWESFIKKEFGVSFKKNEIDGLLSILKLGQLGEDAASKSKSGGEILPTLKQDKDLMSPINLAGMLGGTSQGESACLVPKSEGASRMMTEFPQLLESNLDIDADEMLCEDLYHMRTMVRQITRTIEETLSPDHQIHIESFDRLNALKRKKSKLDELFMKKAGWKPARTTSSELGIKKKKLEDIMKGSEPASHMQQFKAVCEVYELKKSEWLLDTGLNNSFFLYLWSQKEAVQVFLKYLVKIFDAESKNSRKIGLDQKFVNDADVYYQQKGFDPSLACLTTAMMLEDEQPSIALSFLDSIFANVPGTKSTFFKTFDTKNTNKDSILTMFDFMWVMTRFLFFKTFHDTTYDVLSQFNQTMVDLIKSFSEGTNIYLRRLIRDEVQETNIFSEQAQRTILHSFNCQINRILEFTELSFLKYHNYLGMIERPENYTLMINSLRILIEMIAGPDPRSQYMIYESSLNKMMVIVDRIVDDLNSPFYKFKLTVIEYLNCLSQELIVSSNTTYSINQESKIFDESRVKMKITETVANNIRMGMIESVIFRLMKKLYIHTCTKNKPWFKAKPIEKLKQDFERQRQILVDQLGEISSSQYNQPRKNQTSKRIDLYQINDDNKQICLEKIAKINQKLSKLAAFEETYSTFEDKDSVILEEMESSLKIKSHHELLDLYCKDPEFSNSNIVKICAELIKLSFNLSKSAEYFKNSRNERAKTLYSYYGADVPLTNLENIDLSGVPDKSGEEPPEETKVFMFLALLVNQIEVAIPTVTEEGSVYQTKVIMFQLPPQCFMLSPETKNSFIDQMNTDEAVAELLSFHKKFEIEMTSNLASLRQSDLLYKISLHDTLSLLKKFLWYLSLIQNLFLLFSVRKSISHDRITTQFYIFSEATFTWSGVGIAAYTLAVLIIWGYGRYSQNIALAKEDIFRGKKRKKISYEEKLQIYFIKSVLKKSTGVQLLWHLVFSLLGVFISPFFYTLQLLTIVLISHTASYVVRSITTHLRKLALTFLLAVFVIFSFAYLVYRYYNKDWDGQVDNNGTIQMCQDLWECIFYSIDFGLRNGGGVSDAFGTTVSHGRTGVFLAHFLFDISFFLLVSLVLKNIAFGIIIDTFASMRDVISQREAYLNSTCVVCKKTKEQLAKNDENFFNHIASKHDIWMYVFYRVYLNTKEKEDFNGIEAVIHGYIMEDSTDWIPTNKITEKKTILERIDAQIEKYQFEFKKANQIASTTFENARMQMKLLNAYLSKEEAL